MELVFTDLIYDDYKQYEVYDGNFNDFENDYIDGVNHQFRFENNYGASVVKRFGSYGYEQDLFELAVLCFDTDDKNGADVYGQLCYDTLITDGVIGYLTNDKVLELLEKIKNLDVYKNEE